MHFAQPTDAIGNGERCMGQKNDGGVSVSEITHRKVGKNASPDAAGSPHVDHRHVNIERQGPKGTYRERVTVERRTEMKVDFGVGNRATAGCVTVNARNVVCVFGSLSSKFGDKPLGTWGSGSLDEHRPQTEGAQRVARIACTRARNRRMASASLMGYAKSRRRDCCSTTYPSKLIAGDSPVILPAYIAARDLPEYGCALRFRTTKQRRSHEWHMAP